MQDLPVLRCKGNTFPLKPQDTLCFYTYFNVKGRKWTGCRWLSCGVMPMGCSCWCGAFSMFSWARLARVLWVGYNDGKELSSLVWVLLVRFVRSFTQKVDIKGLHNTFFIVPLRKQ